MKHAFKAVALCGLACLLLYAGLWLGPQWTGQLFSNDTGDNAACGDTDLALWQPNDDGSGADPDTIDAWSTQYHDTVRSIVDAVETRDVGTDVDCTNPQPLTALPEVQTLAATLPPWQNGGAENLTPEDTAAVLLEHLRTYECALQKRNLHLSSSVLNELSVNRAPVDNTARFDEETDQRTKMNHELRVARPTLERTLTLLGREWRTRQATADMYCLQAISLDLRNAVALGAEAAACFPRVWDARNPLPGETTTRQ